MKYAFYSIIALVVIGLVVGAYFYGHKPTITSEQVIKEYRTTLPVQTTIIRQQVPAIIDTVWIENESHEIGSYSAVVDTNKVHIGLDIKYDERSNLFDVRHNISTVRDSVYVEKVITNTIYKKPKFIGITGGTTIGFANKDGDIQLNHAGVDLGLKIAGKYSGTVFVDSNSTFGVRLGIDF